MHPSNLLSIADAAERLRAGQVVAYPTEGVYGLGCDPFREGPVRHILALKSRAAEAGLILVGDRYERFLPWIGEVDAALLERARSTWPGPVTWLFPRAAAVPDWLAGSHSTIALRVTAHPQCRALCAAFSGAIVSTSANRAGAPPARSAAEVSDCFGDGIAGIVEGALGGAAGPSEIRDLATGRVIRASAT